jgi:DNA-binding transcriptional ArsR family regulator
MGRSQDGDRGDAAALFEVFGAMIGTPPTPFDHRTRRRILRHLHEDGRARTAAEMAADLGLRLSEVLYHVRVLAEYDTVDEMQEEDRLRFESKIADRAEIIDLLASTKAEDDDAG